MHRLSRISFAIVSHLIVIEMSNFVLVRQVAKSPVNVQRSVFAVLFR